MQRVNCVAVGEICLDHVRVRQDKGCDQQVEVFPQICRLVGEVGKPVVMHCRGTSSTEKECLWIMKGNLPKDSKRHSLQAVELSQRSQRSHTAVQNASKVPAPSNGCPLYRYGASRPRGPAGWLALLLTKAGDVETNPGPKT